MTTTTTTWMPKLNEKVFFMRGMFGEWQGTVREIRAARADRWCSSGGVRTTKKGDLYATVSYQRANGSFGRARVRVSALRPVAPAVSPTP